MKRADTKKSADTLPGFLDEGTERATDETTTVSADPVEVQEGDEGSEGGDGTDGGTDAIAAAEAAAEELLSENDTGPESTTTRPAAARGAGGGGLLTILGCALMLGAAALGFAGEPSGTLLTRLDRFGLSPANLVLAGIVLAGIGSMRGRITTLQRRLDEARDGTDVQASLQSLLAAHQSGGEGTAAGGEGQQHLMMTLQRQDEKIGNLTKALKMYGKPIMEIAAQSTDLAAGMAQAKAAADATLEASKQGWTRLEKTLASGSVTKQLDGLHEDIRKLATAVAAATETTDATLEASKQGWTRLEKTLASGSVTKQLDGLHDEIHKVVTAVEAVAKRAAPTVSLEPLEKQLTRTEVAVQAVAQRLEDTEVRKSLMRLEDSASKARESVQQLLRGESIEKATTSLRERLDQCTTKLSDSLGKLREGQISGIESSVREIQREIASVATRVSQIQASMKSGGGGGGRAAATAATASGGHAPVAPGSAAATPAAAATHDAPAAAPAAPAKDPGATGSYQTGTRTSNSKNVLGAIAKLKQMKG